MPVINYAVMIGCLALVLGFRSSEALGAAYGLAVIGTMTTTSITFFVVTRRVWNWSLARAVPLIAAFLLIDFAFLGANLAKLLSGAWVPLLIGSFVFAILVIWTTQARQASPGDRPAGPCRSPNSAPWRRPGSTARKAAQSS